MDPDASQKNSAPSRSSKAEPGAAGELPGGWITQLADRVLARFPGRSQYTCAAGISPSGIVHFGNFRDVITAFAVAAELRARGHRTRLLFSWDDFDRFRKVPAGVAASFQRYIGFPLTSVPDPLGELASYARRYEVEFENSMRELGIELEYRYQTNEYRSGRYADQISLAMAKRVEVAQIQLEFKTDKGNQERGIDPADFIRSYYPIVVYSRFSGTDKTQVLGYDGGSKITYQCLSTGQVETIDYRETPMVKLPWKVDWPMRWGVEEVHFEPAGKDHASPGGSYEVSAKIAREIFGRPPPVFQGYEFVGIQGMTGKMSGSRGDAISPALLLEIYEPALLKWLYLRRSPTQSFNLAFDSEVIRQYDEFDREVRDYGQEQVQPLRKKILELTQVDIPPAGSAPPIPFRQIVALGQVVQWDVDRVVEMQDRLHMPYSRASVESRIPRARTWLMRYNPQEIISLLDAPNKAYASKLDARTLQRIARLREFLGSGVDSIEAIEQFVYGLPKEPGLTERQIKSAQRKFFQHLYNLTIGRDIGPRLSTFLWAADRESVMRLLDLTS